MLTEAEWYPSSDPAETSVSARIVDWPVPNAIKTKAAGETVNDMKPFIQIKIAGQKDVAHLPLRVDHRKRFPLAWQAYEEGSAEVPGTPIAELPGLSATEAASLRLNGVRTVEQMAGLSDASLQGIGHGARGLQKIARMMLENRTLTTAALADDASVDAPVDTPKRKGRKAA